jgi:hypothetical protein
MTTSRYQTVGTAMLVSRNGDQIPYLLRRFLPVVDESAPARLHLVGVGEVQRPDLVAAAELGQGELSWVLADANPVMRPSQLCQRPGQAVRVPQSSGLVIGQTNAQ